jgi:hypothetical protein
VTVPSFLNAGLSAASFSTVVPARGYSSTATTTGSPFRCGIETGTISLVNAPFCIAAAARRWLSAAKASWSARDTWKRHATSSAVIPMWQALIAHIRPSLIIESIASALPIR